MLQRVRREKTPRERTPQRDTTRHKNRTPPPAAAAPKDVKDTKEKEPVKDVAMKDKEDAAVHSGSEEGEIEED